MKRVASIAVQRKDHILWLSRADNGKWTMPGGHLNESEEPIDGALRELYEETGIRAPKGEMQFLGSGIVNGKLEVFSYLYEPDKLPQVDLTKDPDGEADAECWLDDIPDNVHVPNDNNVTLGLLGRVDCKVELKLAKMAIKDLQPGESFEDDRGEEAYDYSHLLPPKWKKKLSLHVYNNHDTILAQLHDNSGDEWNYSKYDISAPSQIGHVKAMISDTDASKSPSGFSGRSIEPHSEMHEDFHGEGLGKALYEALYTHAFHKMHVKNVIGGAHSEDAGRVHESLARKHGMEYKPKAKYSRFGLTREPYKYVIKAEALQKKTPPKFPQLGVPDDRRPADIVTTPRQVEIKGRALFQGMGQKATFADLQQIKGSLGANSAVNPDVAYALSNKMRGPFSGAGTNAAPATQLHEHMHAIIGRVSLQHAKEQAKQGFIRPQDVNPLAYEFRLNFAQRINKELYARHKNEYLHMTNMQSSMYPGLNTQPIHSEEKLATMFNYLNDPSFRNRYHFAMNHTPEQVLRTHNAMKTLYSGLQNAAKEADHTWIEPEKYTDWKNAVGPQFAKNEELVGLAVDSLTNDLRKPQYRSSPNKLTGHCYVASEALYHMLGGREAGWVPHHVSHEGEPHWYLKHKESGAILDPTAGQFKTPVPYAQGRGKGFLTKEPSKRAVELISRIRAGVAAKNDPTLKKGILGAVAGAALAMSPQLKAGFDKVNPPEAKVQTIKPEEQMKQAVSVAPKWTPDGLHADLIPIAHLESSFGQNMNHTPHSKGDYHTAFGPVGFKPSTAHEEWNKTKKLKQLYPGLEDPKDFMDKFKSDWKFHNLLASSHFMRLMHRHGSPEKAAYAWRWGTGAASGATEDVINKDNYVQRYRDLAASTGIKKSESAGRPIAVKHYSGTAGLKELNPKHQGSGMAGAERGRPNRIPRTYYYHRDAEPEGVVTAGAAHLYHGELPIGTKLYDMGNDKLGLNQPSWKQTKYGQVYNVPNLDHVEKRLQKLGYHGYHNYGTPGALAYFEPLKVKQVVPVRKNEDLNKMAIKDIRPGRPIEGTEAFDFTHVLSPENQQEGYKLSVHKKNTDSGPKYLANVHHRGKVIGSVNAYHLTDINPSRAELASATLDVEHHGRGLGASAYEALYAHLYHNMGVKTIEGEAHSTLAARTHQKLAAKHGLKYPYAKEDATQGRPFDAQFGNYKYNIDG